MKRDSYLGMFLKGINEWFIRMIIGVLKHEVEISDRLMVMNG